MRREFEASGDAAYARAALNDPSLPQAGPGALVQPAFTGASAGQGGFSPERALPAFVLVGVATYLASAYVFDLPPKRAVVWGALAGGVAAYLTTLRPGLLPASTVTAS